MGIEVGLNCPACGGAIKVVEGENTVNCQYCGSMLFVEGDAGVTTISFKNMITRETAVTSSAKWWRKGFKARDLKKVGQVTECYPIYLPFWSTTTRVAGWICGYEERTHSDGKGHTYTERIPKEELVLRDYRFSEIACDPGDLGIKQMKNMNGETALTDFLMIPTFESTTSKDDAVTHAKGSAMTNARADARVPHITFEKVHVFPKAMSMIYYPIWVVRYTYRDRMYLNTVDGVTGTVLSGRAPGDPLFQSLAVTAGTSIGGLLGATGIIIANYSGEAAVGCFIVGVVVMIVTYLFFRGGSEITEGEFSDRGFKLGDLKGVAEQLSQGRVGGNNWGEI
jgi:DNA-directed RNA polymerase subunit RPC12/RpoP